MRETERDERELNWRVVLVTCSCCPLQNDPVPGRAQYSCSSTGL